MLRNRVKKAVSSANADKPTNTESISMGKHVSIILRDDLWHLMESKRGLASKSAYLNHAIETFFRDLEGNE
jgi:hypothetical protein